MPAKRGRGRPAGQTPPRKNVCVRILTDLYEQAQAAVLAAGDRTLTDVLERHLRRYVATAQRVHNGGRPFPVVRRGEADGRSRGAG